MPSRRSNSRNRAAWVIGSSLDRVGCEARSQACIASSALTPLRGRAFQCDNPEGARAMTPESARNIDFVAAHDLDGRGDGVQIMVHKGHAFIGHMFSDGFTV